MHSIFESEVKEKNQQRHALRAKTNGRRSSGHMFATDFMTKEQRAEYTKAGEVMLSNIWDEILGRAQFDELSDEKKKTALEHWYKMHGTGKIKKKLGFSDYQLYRLYEKLGVEYTKRPNVKRKAKATAAPKEKPAAKKVEQQQALALHEVETEEKPAAESFTILPPKNSGSTFYLDDILQSEEAIGKLMKYAAFLEGEANKFRLRIEITEVKQ